MKSSDPRLLILTLAWSVLMAVTARAQTTTVTSTTYTSGQNVTVNGPAHVATSGTVTVSSGAAVTFKATAGITLSPGFTSVSGSAFRAFIHIDTDVDGIPDDWETAHGLNPVNAADAAYTTSLGLTNLLEYLLSTTPGAAKQADSSNGNALKIHRPNNP